MLRYAGLAQSRANTRSKLQNQHFEKARLKLFMSYRTSVCVGQQAAALDRFKMLFHFLCRARHVARTEFLEGKRKLGGQCLLKKKKVFGAKRHYINQISLSLQSLYCSNIIFSGFWGDLPKKSSSLLEASYQLRYLRWYPNLHFRVQALKLNLFRGRTKILGERSCPLLTLAASLCRASI